MINEQANVEVRVNDQQALKRVDELTKKLDRLAEAKAKANSDGDLKKIREIQKEYNKTNAELTKLQTYTQNVDRAVKNINTATPKELKDTIKAINRELGSGRIARDSKEWNEYISKLRDAKAELRSIQDLSKVEKGPSLFSRITRTGTELLGTYTIFTDTIQNVRSWLNQRVQAYAEMEEAEAQVRKYTGITKAQVKDLNEELKKIDTRTSREQLNALAGDAGRLGITSKEMVLEFVGGADIIKTALGDDLGETAVRDIGKLAQMFGEDKTKGLRGAMLATGSAVNELAQNSSASADYLVDFTSRLAGVAQQAGISQANIMGYASALDQNMQQVETSATVFSQLITKFFQQPERFAKLAGMAVEDFTNLLKTDANQALLQFLQTMQSKGGFDALAPMFEEMKLNGTRAVGVLSSVATHLDQVTRAQNLANQAYDEGTSVVEEFNVQNDTVQARLEKARKRANDLAVALGEKLLPVVTNGLHLTSSVTKALIEVIEFTGKNTTAVVTTTAAIAALTVAANLYAVKLKLINTWTKIVTASTAALNAVSKVNPWVLAATGFATLVAWLSTTETAADKAKNAVADMNGELEQSKKLLGEWNSGSSDKDQLAVQTEAEIKALDERIAAERKVAAEERQMAKERLENNTKKFPRQIRYETEQMEKAYSERMKASMQLERQRTELQWKLSKFQSEHSTWQKPGSASPTVDNPITPGTSDSDRQKQIRAAVDAAKAQADAEEAVLMAKYSQGQIDYKQYTAAIAQLQIDLQDKLLTIYEQGTTEYASVLKQRMQLVMKQREDERKQVADNEKERIDSELAWISQQERLNNQQLQDQFMAGKLSTEAYNQARFEAEIRFLRQRQSLYTSDSAEFQKLQQQIDDKVYADRMSKYQEYQQQLEQVREQYQQKSAAELQMQEIAQLDAIHNYGLISEEEYQRLRAEIIKRYSEESFQNSMQAAQMMYSELTSMVSAYSSFVSAASEAEAAAIEARYDREIELAGSNTAKAKKLEEKKQKEVAAVKNKYNRQAMRIEVAQALASTAMAAINAYASAAKIPIVGPAMAPIAAAAAIAAGMLQVATIQKQQQAQQQGYYTGGFTGSGDYRKEAGVVHRGEFVANHEAVANPNLLPVLRLIDYAQRNNSVGSLTAADVSRAVNPMVLTSPAASAAPSSDNTTEAVAVMVAASERMQQTVDRLTQTLDEGIESYVTIDGPRGFDRQYRHWQRLHENK